MGAGEAGEELGPTMSGRALSNASRRVTEIRLQFIQRAPGAVSEDVHRSVCGGPPSVRRRGRWTGDSWRMHVGLPGYSLLLVSHSVYMFQAPLSWIRAYPSSV